MQAVSFESERADASRLSQQATGSDIVRGKSGFLSNFGEHYSSDFFAVMKSEHVIAVLWMIQFDEGNLFAKRSSSPCGVAHAAPPWLLRWPTDSS